MSKYYNPNEWDYQGECTRNCSAYQQGRADRDKELAEHNVFCSNIPIEDIVFETIEAERERIVKELEEKLSEKRYQHDGEDYYVGIIEVLEIVKGGENDR